MPVKKINVSELSTNQVLARAVVNSNGNILMYEGARIRKENIQKLIKNNISEVFIEDNMLKDSYKISETLYNYTAAEHIGKSGYAFTVSVTVLERF